MNKKNNNQLLYYLNIEYLKNNLAGKIISMNKGIKLEEFFNYYIQLKQNDGDSIDNLENESILFNYNKSDRSFEVDLIGFVMIKDTLDETTTITTLLESKNINNSMNEFVFKLLNYEFYEKTTIDIYHENVKFTYDINKFKLTPKDKIEVDFCNELKEIGKNKEINSKSSNIFEKPRSIFNQDEEIKKKLHKINMILISVIIILIKL